MSKALGKINEVNNVAKCFQETNIPRYKNNKNVSSWEKIENVVKTLKIYLPDCALDYIYKDKIYIEKDMFRKYTFISVPDTPDEMRIIRFPSKNPIEEYEREYAFYLGCLLSFYQVDTEEELLELGQEYDEILPLILDYLYLKQTNKEELFLPKVMDRLKNCTKNYPKVYNKYMKYCDNLDKVNHFYLSDREYDLMKVDILERNTSMEEYTLNVIKRLSGANGMLQLMDKNLSVNDFKELIEKLMLNESQNRSSILYDYGVDSSYYRRLTKELNSYKK